MSGRVQADFDPGALFTELDMQAVSSSDLDAVLQAGGAALQVLLLWGRDCVNCEIAKRQLLAHRSAVQAAAARWLQANVYDDFDLATRFGLHGVPTFIVFRQGRKLGRITSWPGLEPFLAALARTAPADGAASL